MHLDVAARAFHVAGVGQGVAKVDLLGQRGRGARSVRFAWQAWGMVRAVASLGIVLRGRRREACAITKIAGFRGPGRQIACARARVRVLGVANRGRRRESVDLWM